MKYRVFISQVDRKYIDVEARNENEACTKGYKEWLEEVKSYVEDIQELQEN